MKFSATAILALAVVSTYADTDVTIGVVCNGVDMNKLPLQDEIIVGYALEKSFGQVQELNEYSISNVKGDNGSFVGQWGCRLCHHDDIVEGSFVNSAAASTWGAELSTMLAQSGSSTLVHAKSCSVKISETAEEEQSPVAIQFGCSGARMDKLSGAESAVVSQILQDSYNKVEDNELTNVVVRGPVSSSLNLRQSASRYASAVGQWGCRLCHHDDVVLANTVSGAAANAWEAKFAAGLAATGMKAFQNIGTCQITMSLEEVEEPNVELAVACDGASLSSAAAKDVEAAFNKSNVNGQTLSSVTSNGPSFVGQWGCRLCHHDDEVLASTVSGAATNAWEKELASLLQKESCDITMKSLSAAMSTN